MRGNKGYIVDVVLFKERVIFKKSEYCSLKLKFFIRKFRQILKELYGVNHNYWFIEEISRYLVIIGWKTCEILIH